MNMEQTTEKYLLILNGPSKFLLHGIPTLKDENGKDQKVEHLCIWKVLGSYKLNQAQSDKLGIVSLLVFESYEVQIKDNVAYITKSGL